MENVYCYISMIVTKMTHNSTSNKNDDTSLLTWNVIRKANIDVIALAIKSETAPFLQDKTYSFDLFLKDLLESNSKSFSYEMEEKALLLIEKCNIVMNNALFIVCQIGCSMKILKALLKQGANPRTGQETIGSVSPFTIACCSKNYLFLKTLINNEQDIGEEHPDFDFIVEQAELHKNKNVLENTFYKTQKGREQLTKETIAKDYADQLARKLRKENALDDILGQQTISNIVCGTIFCLFTALFGFLICASTKKDDFVGMSICLFLVLVLQVMIHLKVDETDPKKKAILLE
jgi:hypothetical protein